MNPTTRFSTQPRADQIDRRTAGRLANEAGARDVPLIVSYLRWSTNEADGLASLAAIRANSPELFTQKRNPRFNMKSA
jgi:hypothetical protein